MKDKDDIIEFEIKEDITPTNVCPNCANSVGKLIGKWLKKHWSKSIAIIAIILNMLTDLLAGIHGSL